MVDNLWATTIVVLPLDNFSKDFCIKYSVALSRAEVASSSISIGGFFKNTLAMDNLCFCPPDNFIPLSPI